MTAESREQKVERYGQAHGLLLEGLRRFPREMWHFRPADEWTIHETVIHIADSEANSYVRLRRGIAESGQGVMAYDEGRWAEALAYHDRDPHEALELFRWLRQSSYHLLLDQTDAIWTQTIEHPENGTMRLDQWLDIYARHVPEHLAQMEAVHEAWEQQQGKARPAASPEPTPSGSGEAVTLRAITKESLREVLRLEVGEAQNRFVASNAISIAQAHFEPHAWYRAIYAGDTPVGFVMLHNDPEEGEYFLWRFMIDAAQQGKGYGARAIERVVEYVRGRPGARTLGVSYVPGEGSPELFYRRLGFVPTGEVEHGELIARLSLDPSG